MKLKFGIGPVQLKINFTTKKETADYERRIVAYQEDVAVQTEEIRTAYSERDAARSDLEKLNLDYGDLFKRTNELSAKLKESEMKNLHFTDWVEVELFSRLMVKKLEQHNISRGGKSWRRTPRLQLLGSPQVPHARHGQGRDSRQGLAIRQHR